MIRFPGILWGILWGSALGLLLGGCSDSRDEAASELHRLNEAMHQHAERYGEFPETLDPGRTSTRTNLSYTAEGKVRVRLLGATPTTYAATARRGVWLCGVQVSRGQKALPDCTPTGNESAESAEAAPAPPLQRILPQTESPPVDSLPGHPESSDTRK